MGLFNGYSDPQQFRDSGGLPGRLLSLQPQYAQYQGAGFDQASSVPQTPMLQPMPWPNLPGYSQPPSVSQPLAQDLHSQYQALRPFLGDRDAMLATVHPEMGQTLVAQAMAGQQRSGNVGDASMSAQGQPIVSDASPDPITPGSQYAQAPMALCATGLGGCAVGAWLTAGQLLGGAALTGAGAIILNNKAANRPPAGSRPINQTDWSGDHGEIKQGVGAQGDDDVRISPTGEVWAKKPDGSWENHGDAKTFTGSGRPSGRRGKDKDRW
jgi:hypothetical protein